MGAKDVSFTFDTKSFQEAMAGMAKGMTELVKNSSKAEQNVTKGTFKAMALFGVMKSLVLGAVRGITSTVKQFVPEIGTAFGIAKNIMLRNLLMPLRKEFLPSIQKVLDWVRNNRKVFVDIGVVLVNTFRLLKQLMTSVVKLLSPIANQIIKLFKSIFGDSTKSITETINVAIFKMTSFILALETLLAPLSESLGKILGATIENIKSFAKGFVENFKKTFDVGKEMKDLIDTLASTFDKLSQALIKLKPAMEIFGKVIGTVVAVNLKVVIELIKQILNLFGAVYGVIANPKNFKNIMSELGKNLAKSGSEIWETIKKGAVNIGDVFKTKKVEDAIITKKGDVIQTSPNDTIIATKNGLPGGNNVTLNFPGMVLQVTEGNAENAGKNFVNGIEQRLRNALINSMMTAGATP